MEGLRSSREIDGYTLPRDSYDKHVLKSEICA